LLPALPAGAQQTVINSFYTLITNEANQTGQSIKSFSKIFIHCVFLRALNFAYKKQFFYKQEHHNKNMSCSSNRPAVFKAWYMMHTWECDGGKWIIDG